MIEEKANLVHFEEERRNHLEVNQKFREIMDAERARRRRELQIWLNAEDQHERHVEALEVRHQETGVWLLSNRSFKDWSSVHFCTDALLWLHGIPGSGKTVLAAIAIENVRKQQAAMVAFHFCRYTDSQRNKFVLLARSILSQLLVQDADLLPFLFEKMGRNQSLHLSDESLAKYLLEAALGSRSNTFIIIDGLDEYSDKDRDKITTWFKEQTEKLSKQKTGLLRCLFISQDDRISRRAFSNVTSIEIGADDNADDIYRYCVRRREEIEDKHGIKLTGDHDIARTVAATSQGRPTETIHFR